MFITRRDRWLPKGIIIDGQEQVKRTCTACADQLQLVGTTELGTHYTTIFEAKSY